jgi:hypothetical protein
MDMISLDWTQLAAQATLIGMGVGAITWIAKSTTAALIVQIKGLHDAITGLEKSRDDGEKFHQDAARELGGIQADLKALNRRVDAVDFTAHLDRGDRELGDRDRGIREKGDRDREQGDRGREKGDRDREKGDRDREKGDREREKR